MRYRYAVVSLVLVLILLLGSGGLLSRSVSEAPASTTVFAADFQTKYRSGLILSRGELPRFDRSRLAILPVDLPSVVDLSGALPPVGHQRFQNSCVAWTLGYYNKTFQERVEHSWDVSVPQHQFSPAWIYNQRETDDCERDEGMSFQGGLAILRDKGAATLATVPYDPYDPCSLPAQAAFDEAWPYRVEDYAIIFGGRGSADLNTLKRILAAGEPLAIAIPIYPSFYLITYEDPVVRCPVEGETWYGHHALLVVGYDNNIGGFLAVNSWGVNWGRDGFCWLSYEFVQNEAAEAWTMEDFVEVVEVPTGTPTIPATATPTPRPTVTLIPTSTLDPTATVTPFPTGTNTPSPTPSATVTSVPPATPTSTRVDLVISNLWVKSGRDYRVQRLTTGDRYYIDRSYRVVSAPPDFRGLTWIRTANNDKRVTAPTFLTFDLNVEAWVFVVYDARAKAIPAWLRSFTPVGEEIRVTGGGASRLTIYGREFPAGRVILGGNQANGFSGVSANYMVLLRANR